MPVEVLGVSDGVIEFAVTGKLSEQALSDAQQAAAAVIREHGSVRILVNAERFDGWEQGGDWDDFSFEEKFDPYIKKMAFIGDRKWEDLVLVFSNKAFREFPIEYFDSADADFARAWLSA